MDNEIIKYDNFVSLGRNEKKSQIILCHTSREVKEYLTSLKFRNNGKYSKIPHYIITQKGEIFQLLEDEQYSNFFDEFKLNKNSIIISLENLGWLEKEPLKDQHINWIGNIYKGNIIEKKWRDYFFWHPYTDIQLTVCAELCKMLTEKFPIDKKCIGHNTKVDGIQKYNGIITRSNLDSEYTDVSPAFDFEIFINKIEK